MAITGVPISDNEIPSRVEQTRKDMNAIGSALEAYKVAQGAYPPDCVCDARKPTRSWAARSAGACGQPFRSR